jgi:peptidoglycan/LPS O-acetylase OafA/YrhL
MVFNVHFFAQYYQQSYFVAPGSIAERIIKILHSGHIGVDLFFVISGFLIYRSLRKNNPSPTDFFKNRINRLLPAHLLVLLWVGLTSFSLKNFLINATFMSAFIKGSTTYNFVTWSLGWEWLFYLLIFLIFSMSKRQSIKHFIFSILILAILALIFQQPATQKLEVLGIIMPSTGRFLGFFVGVIVACIESDMGPLISNNTNILRVASILALLNIVLMGLLWTYKAEEIQQSDGWSNLYYITVAISFGVILLRAVTIQGHLNQILELRLFRILGQISYSFYLVHAIIGIPLSLKIYSHIDTFPKMIASYVVTIFVTFLLATFVFFYLERPHLLHKKA